MKRNKISRLLAVSMSLCLLAAGLTGCSSSGEDSTEQENTAEDSSSQESAETTEILVAAAASLEYAYEEELIPMFEEQNPGVTVKGTYDSSGKLQTQIEEGLEADVFMSAATQQDITKADTIAIGDPASVPAGQYAQEALTNLGIWDEVLAKASLGTNVTEVLNWVAEGSAQAGIVYATDAATTDNVKVIAQAPEGSLAEPAIYPVGLVASSAHQEEAQAFLDFLQSDEAMAVFEEYGFVSHADVQ